MMGALTDLLLALAAGVLTIAAPCILPMLPILLGASMSTSADAGRGRPAFIALGFVLAFSGCAIVFSLFADSLQLSQQTLRDAAVVLLLTFGLLMLWKRPLDLLAVRMGGLVEWAAGIGRRAEMGGMGGRGNLGGLILGASMGVVWTPCAGPVLGSALTLLATQRDVAHASAMLLAYALGAGIPMLAIAYGGQLAATRVRRLARHAVRMQQAFGVLIILTAVAMHTEYDAAVTLWLAGVAA